MVLAKAQHYPATRCWAAPVASGWRGDVVMQADRLDSQDTTDLLRNRTATGFIHHVKFADACAPGVQVGQSIRWTQQIGKCSRRGA
jgi:hypothetical protein